MKGHHKVKKFRFASGVGNGVDMPQNWKPFAVVPHTSPRGIALGVDIYARSWVRDEDAD